MGEEWTQEELVTLGELEETSGETASGDPGDPAAGDEGLGEPGTPGEKPVENDPEHGKQETSPASAPKEEGSQSEEQKETENLIPQSRFDKVYGKAKDLEERMDRLKTSNPEAYYRAFPDERPVGWKPGKEADPAEKGGPSLDQMKVQGGPYDGMTLAEVREESPAAYRAIVFHHEQKLAAEAAEARTAEEKVKAEVQKELDAFADAWSRENYGKTADKLTDQEKAAMDKDADAVSRWIEEKAAAGYYYPMGDAFYLMNRDRLLEKAREKGKAEIVDKLRGTGTGMQPGGDPGAEPGYESWLGLTTAQLGARIDKMSESKFADFMKNAPEALKKQHPNFAWD